MENKYINELLIEDLPDSFRDVAELLGMEKTIELITNFSGCAIYVPITKVLTRCVRDRHITEEAERGIPSAKIAVKYGISHAWTQKIINDYRAKKPNNTV